MKPLHNKNKDTWGDRQFTCPSCSSTDIDELGTRADGVWDCLCCDCGFEFEAEEMDEDTDDNCNISS
jgi:transcription elongation factor Elf1